MQRKTWHKRLNSKEKHISIDRLQPFGQNHNSKYREQNVRFIIFLTCVGLVFHVGAKPCSIIYTSEITTIIMNLTFHPLLLELVFWIFQLITVKFPPAVSSELKWFVVSTFYQDNFNSTSLSFKTLFKYLACTWCFHPLNGHPFCSFVWQNDIYQTLLILKLSVCVCVCDWTAVCRQISVIKFQCCKWTCTAEFSLWDRSLLCVCVRHDEANKTTAAAHALIKKVGVYERVTVTFEVWMMGVWLGGGTYDLTLSRCLSYSFYHAVHECKLYVNHFFSWCICDKCAMGIQDTGETK